jgi:hypothetical protein
MKNGGYLWLWTDIMPMGVIKGYNFGDLKEKRPVGLAFQTKYLMNSYKIYKQ